MQLNINYEHIDSSEAIQSYLEEKIGGLDEIMDNFLTADIVVGKTTQRHEKGEIFKCRVNLTYPGGMFRADKVEEDLYAAIDACKDVLHREITSFKEKNRNH